MKIKIIKESVSGESANERLKIYTYTSVQNAPFPHRVRWYVHAPDEKTAREMINKYININGYSFRDIIGGRQVSKKEMRQKIKDLDVELDPNNYNMIDESVNLNNTDTDIIKELNKCKTIDEVDAVVDRFKGYHTKRSEHNIGRNEIQTTIFVYRDDPLVWRQTFTEKLNKVGDNMSTKSHLKESFDKYDYFKDIRSILNNTVMDSKSSKDNAVEKLLGLKDQLMGHVKIERDNITLAGTEVLLSIKNALNRLGYNLSDEDIRLDESVMAPTPTPYKADFTSAQIEPLIIFALFGEENKPLLSNRGVVITSEIGEDFEQTYANSLYRLIKNLKDVYVIDNDVYDKTKDFRTDEEFYDFVKDHGKKLEFTDKNFVEPTQDNSIFDDTDFLIKMTNS